MTWKPPRLTYAPQGFRTLSLVASLSVCSALAGCGGGSHATIPRTDADQLAALAKQIAGEGPCAQRRDIPRLQQNALQLVSAQRISADLGRQLVAGTNVLAADAPPCVPAVPTTTVTPPQPKKPPKPHDDHHDHHHGKHG
jgi:hypothetical protein